VIVNWIESFIGLNSYALYLNVTFPPSWGISIL